MNRKDEGHPSGLSQAIHWYVAGRVQGVGFRYHVREAARRHNVAGDVRNLPDGRVEIRAAGGKLEQFLAEVRQGPPGSRVDRVERLALDPVPPFEGFEIRF